MTSTSSWDHLDRDPCVTKRLPYDTLTPRRARQLMVEDLRAAEVRSTVIEDAETVLAELAANAIEHGRPDDDGTIEVSWCLHLLKDHLLISVLDFGDVATDLDALPLTDDALRGRGLAIVDYLCSTWAVHTGDGVRVTAELDFSSL